MDDAKIKDMSVAECPFCGSNHLIKTTSLSVLSVVFIVLATGSLAELLFSWIHGTADWVKWFLMVGVWGVLAVVSLNRKKAKCLDCTKSFKIKGA